MDLDRLYGGSFVDWEAVAASWNKRTIPSRLLLFAARRYLEDLENRAPEPDRESALSSVSLPDDIKQAYSLPPDPEKQASQTWGRFVDAAVAAELEMVSYGERPPLLHELRAGLTQAAEEAGDKAGKSGWFLDRREALPGTDLPDSPEYMPF